MKENEFAQEHKNLFKVDIVALRNGYVLETKYNDEDNGKEYIASNYGELIEIMKDEMLQHPEQYNTGIFLKNNAESLQVTPNTDQTEAPTSEDPTSIDI